MRKPSVMRTNPDPTTVKLHLPVLDDTTAVMIYNFLGELVDHFDTHYGEQICRFYPHRSQKLTRGMLKNLTHLLPGRGGLW